MANVIAIAVIVLIVGSAAAYIIRAKKKGQHCIGCPSAKSCNGGCCPSADTRKKNNKGSTKG